MSARVHERNDIWVMEFEEGRIVTDSSAPSISFYLYKVIRRTFVVRIFQLLTSIHQIFHHRRYKYVIVDNRNAEQPYVLKTTGSNNAFDTLRNDQDLLRLAM